MSDFSYRFSTSNASLANNASLTFPWAKADADGGKANTGGAEVIVAGKLLPGAQYTLTWTGSPTYTVAFQNKTGATIPPQTDIVIRVPEKLAVKGDTIVANGTVAVTVTALGPTGARTTIQKWLKVTDDAGNPFYAPLY